MFLTLIACHKMFFIYYDTYCYLNIWSLSNVALKIMEKKKNGVENELGRSIVHSKESHCLVLQSQVMAEYKCGSCQEMKDVLL